MIARRHHYVPQFYLKGFSVARKKGRQLVVFDCQTCETFPTSTKNVAVETDFDRIAIEGHAPDTIEKAFAEFEAKIASALARIIAKQSISAHEDREYLFNLIALLAVRNPRKREEWRGFQERVAEQILRLTTATYRARNQPR